jgi:hypothetical protein
MAERARLLYQDRMSLRVGVDQIEDMLAKVAPNAERNVRA